MLSTVYGPVPSWRLGRSLGIDPLTPPKTCTYDCVYCQLGGTVEKVRGPEDLKFKIGVGKVLEDLRRTLRGVDPKCLDHLTFSGTGEPTLNLELGDMIDSARELIDDVPIAILTNASTLNRRDVRENLARADLVIAKLDAPDQGLFEAINRPVKWLMLEAVMDGLESLRHQMHGRLALQMMFFWYLDDSKSNSKLDVVEDLARLARSIGPDEVQINTPTRPPSQGHVLPLKFKRIDDISKIFKAMLSDVKVVSRDTPLEIKKTPRHKEAIEAEVLGLLKRRPCRLSDLAKSIGIKEESLLPIVDGLIASGSITPVHFQKDYYYRTPV